MRTVQAAAKAAAEGGSDEEPLGLAGMAEGPEEGMPDAPSVEAVKQQVDERTGQYARKRAREEDLAEEEDDLSSVPMLQGAGLHAPDCTRLAVDRSCVISCTKLEHCGEVNHRPCVAF